MGVAVVEVGDEPDVAAAGDSRLFWPERLGDADPIVGKTRRPEVMTQLDRGAVPVMPLRVIQTPEPGRRTTVLADGLPIRFPYPV